MKYTRRLGGLAAMAGLLFLGACTEDPSDPLNAAEEAQLNLDVASYAAEETADDISLMTAESDPVMGGAPFASPPIGDLEVTRLVTFYDETGAEMDAFHPQLTEAINIFFSMQGSRSRVGDRGTVSMSVSRERDLTVSGLLGEETQRTWNGSGAASRNRSVHTDANGDREYYFSATTQIESVVIPVPRGSGWPLSGSITRQVSIEIVSGLQDTRMRERTVRIEFNGTNLVPITINGVTFTLNLETHEIVDATS